MARYLAVAYQTAETPEFIDAVRHAAEQDPAAEFVLLVPATPVSKLATWTEGEAGALAAEKAVAARRQLEHAGVRVVDAESVIIARCTPSSTPLTARTSPPSSWRRSHRASRSGWPPT